MMEVYVLVPRLKGTGIQFAAIFLMVLGGMILLVSCLLPYMAPVAVLVGAAGGILQFNMNKEFEYSYFDGEVRFARIMNKNRRKQLLVMPMDEVVTIAPGGDRSVYKYETDSAIKVLDYTSGRKGCPYYVMISVKGERYTLIKFEPDDKYLDAVCMKYGQKVIRKKGQ